MPTFSPTSRTCLGTLATRAGAGDKLALKFYNYLLGENSLMEFVGYSFRPVIERMVVFDVFVRQYLGAHPHARVLNIGCGFCTRFSRLDNGLCSWTDLDVEEVIDVRRALYPENKRYKLKTKNLYDDIDEDYDLLIAEGCLMYIDEDRAREIIHGDCIFDVLGPNSNIPIEQTAMKWRFHVKKWSSLHLKRAWRYDEKGRDTLILASD